MAQLPSALRCHSARPSVHVLAVALHGHVDDGRDAAPRRGARAGLERVATANVPPNGSSMWVCTSMPPGITYLPVASIVASAVMPSASAWPGASTAAIVSPSISTSWAMRPVGLTTLPFLISVSLRHASTRSS